MTNEEAITRLKGLYGNGYSEQEQALDMAIRALKNEQTDGELISRKDLLKDIADLKKSPWFNEGKDIKDLFQRNSYVARKEAVEIIEDLCIKNMQSAEKTAKWRIVGKTTLHYECSKCGGVGDKWDNYCKHCGAKMKESEEE